MRRFIARYHGWPRSSRLEPLSTDRLNRRSPIQLYTPIGLERTDTPILGHPDLPVQPSLRLLDKAFPRVPVPTLTKRHTRRRQSQMQTKKDAPTTEPTPIGTLDGFQATRIRLAQKSLSITLPLS